MIQNVKKILAPIDFSELSMEAMREAMELAKDVGAEVHLAHVIAPHHTFIPLPLATNAEQSRELAREAAMLARVGATEKPADRSLVARRHLAGLCRRPTDS